METSLHKENNQTQTNTTLFDSVNELVALCYTRSKDAG